MPSLDVSRVIVNCMNIVVLYQSTSAVSTGAPLAENLITSGNETHAQAIIMLYQSASAVLTGAPLADNLTTSGNETHAQAIQNRDRHALLYIVVTLLFYSLGIIVAMIMYLKREKQEMVEDKAYDDYMAVRNDPYGAMRKHRVEQMLLRMKELARASQREENENMRQAGREEKLGTNRERRNTYPGCPSPACDSDVKELSTILMVNENGGQGHTHELINEVKLLHPELLDPDKTVTYSPKVETSV